MVIMDFLERNAKVYPDDVALVEINPQAQPKSWREYSLIESSPGEKYRRSILGENPAGPGGVDNFPDFLHSRADGTEGEKLPFAGIGYDSCKGGLAYARRAPQYEGTQVAALYHVAEYATLADQMPLAYIIVERMRPKTFRKRRKETCHYLISFLYERRRLCWMRSNASK